MGHRAHLYLPAALAAVACLAAAAAMALFAMPARADQIVTQTLDGPDPASDGLGGIAQSRDGGAAIVYLKQVTGVDRVFVVSEQNGTWSTPQQLDGSLAGPSSAPAVAASDGGRIVVIFLDGGELYATVRPAAGKPFTVPQPVAGGASLPDVSMSEFGTAYLSFTGPGPGGSDVYVARMDRTATAFVLFAQPFNLDAAQAAGYNAALRSRVATATDGSALVAWGENNPDGHTHVIARRVSGEGLSWAPQDLTQSSLDGLAGLDADSPSVTLEDASDFGWVAFRQTFLQGTTPVSRVLAAHQLGSTFNPPVAIDSLPVPAADAADDPEVQIDGSGGGFSTVETTLAHEVFADRVDGNAFSPAVRVDAAANTIAPQPQAVVGGVDDLGGVAWMQSTGPTDPASVHLRVFNGSGFGAEEVTSVPPQGPVDTATGVSAASDRYGDVLAAFLQGAPGATRLQVGGDINPPRAVSLALTSQYTDATQPLIQWNPAYDGASTLTYAVYENGKLAGMTSADEFRTPSPVAQGSFPVRLVAINGWGQRASSKTLTVTSVTTPPQISLSITGHEHAGKQLTFTASATSPAPVPAPIASVRVEAGDGLTTTVKGAQETVMHAYKAKGAYTVTVVAQDVAGNRSVVHRRLHIK